MLPDLALHPGHGARHVVDLLLPGHLGLQAIADRGDTDIARREEATDVADRRNAEPAHRAIAARPATAVHEYERGPTGARWQEEIEPVLVRMGTRPFGVGQVELRLTVRKHRGPVVDCGTHELAEARAAERGHRAEGNGRNAHRAHLQAPGTSKRIDLVIVSKSGR